MKKPIIPEKTNWEYLKRFMICAESKNFGEACSKIGTGYSALNNQLNALESELGVNLFYKVSHNRTVKLTPQGKAIYGLIKDVGLHLKGISTLHSYEGWEEIPELNIVTTPGIATTLLPSPICKFHKNYNNVKVRVSTEFVPRPINYNEIMIRSDFFVKDKIEKVFLFTHKVNLYASPKYIEKYGAPKKASDLLEHQNLVLANTHSRRTDWATLSSGTMSSLYYITSDSINLLFEMCLQGEGILELPDIYPGVENLVQVLKDEKSPEIDIYACGHKSIVSQDHVTDFINLLKDEWGRS